MRDIMAGFGGIVGGRSKTMEKKMNDLTKVVLEELQTQARTLYPGAVAIVGVNIDFSQIGSGENDKFIAGQGSGTVLVRRSAPSPAPAPQAGGRRKRKAQTRRRRN